MAVKKGNLEQFLSVESLYVDNNKSLRSIFIDKDEQKVVEPENFLETSLTRSKNEIGTQLEHNKNTIGTHNSDKNDDKTRIEQIIGTHKEHNWSTKQQDKEHIRNTIGTQQEHKSIIRNTTRTQLEHVKEHKIEHIKDTTRTQLEHNKNTSFKLSYLTGVQRQLVVFFYLSCKKTRSHTTEEFSLHNIADALKIKLGSIKTSLRRLEEKGFLKGIKFKKGRGGWTQFELPDGIYRELLENEKEHNWNTIGTQLEHKTDTYRNTETDTNASSSSSYNIKTTTTELSEEWNFDISSYNQFGFGITQLKQLVGLGNVSASNVEQSLIEFNYDFENNALPHIKTNKVNFLMGLLRGGNAYISEHYRTEQEKAIKLMAERAAQKEKTQVEEKFMAWEYQLSIIELEEILKKMPNYLTVLYKAHGTKQNDVKKWLMDYYLQKCSTYNNQ